MNITALIPLLKLFEESGAVSPKGPTFRPPKDKKDDIVDLEKDPKTNEYKPKE